ncbi:MAG: hypothetical protein KC636_27505 [Myxococcales bacterium]|nr:hypothetical protein [Myxococcales bacterium]
MRRGPLLALTLLLACDDGPPDDDHRLVAKTPACDPVAEWSDDDTAFEDRAVALINEVRTRGGACGATTYPRLPPLATSPALRCAARVQASSMAVGGYVDHRDPSQEDAPGLYDRLVDAGYPQSTYVEIIGVGWPSADEAVDAWLTSELTCWKLMSPDLREIGIGVTIGDTPSDDDVDEDGRSHFWDVVIAVPNG